MIENNRALCRMKTHNPCSHWWIAITLEAINQYPLHLNSIKNNFIIKLKQSFHMIRFNFHKLMSYSIVHHRMAGERGKRHDFSGFLGIFHLLEPCHQTLSRIVGSHCHYDNLKGGRKSGRKYPEMLPHCICLSCETVSDHCHCRMPTTEQRKSQDHKAIS